MMTLFSKRPSLLHFRQIDNNHNLKLGERFLGCGALSHLQGVEFDCLGQGPENESY